MTVQLLASYFKDAHFHDSSFCPLALAIKATYNTDRVDAGIVKSYIDGEKHYHESYEPHTFEMDKKLAVLLNYDDTVIREIDIIKPS